jgi:hypothetical protein
MELEKENHRLKAELSHLKHHAQNLEAILNSIKSAKAFKFWQE